MNIPIHGDGGDLGDLSCGGYGFGVGREEGDDVVDGSLGVVVEVHGVANILDAFGVDSTGMSGGCCHSIPGHFVGLCTYNVFWIVGVSTGIRNIVQFKTYLLSIEVLKFVFR
jgi:hypothetical protein